jgi:hypothetical protein
VLALRDFFTYGSIDGKASKPFCHGYGTQRNNVLSPSTSP